MCWQMTMNTRQTKIHLGCLCVMYDHNEIMGKWNGIKWILLIVRYSTFRLLWPMSVLTMKEKMRLAAAAIRTLSLLDCGSMRCRTRWQRAQLHTHTHILCEFWHLCNSSVCQFVCVVHITLNGTWFLGIFDSRSPDIRRHLQGLSNLFCFVRFSVFISILLVRFDLLYSQQSYHMLLEFRLAIHP